MTDSQYIRSSALIFAFFVIFFLLGRQSAKSQTLSIEGDKITVTVGEKAPTVTQLITFWMATIPSRKDSRPVFGAYEFIITYDNDDRHYSCTTSDGEVIFPNGEGKKTSSTDMKKALKKWLQTTIGKETKLVDTADE